MTAVMGGNRLAQGRKPARRCILVGTFLYGASGGLQNFVGPAEVWKSLTEVYRLVLGRGEAHALENAGLHLLVERVQMITPVALRPAISTVP